MMRAPTRALISVVGPSATTRPAAARCELAHGRPERATALYIHRHRRLVEDQQLRVAHECDCETHALGLSAREAFGAAVGDLVEPDQVDHVLDRQRVGVERGHHRDQLAHGHVADDCSGLQHRADGPCGDGVLR
jgi:hypothetical protein